MPAIRVLLVDDEPSLLEISKQFLELDHSISVDTALSANDALKRIERREYDVLVSDYQMPMKNGIQLLKEIRANGNSIPFIIFTGKGREEVAIEALNAGADFYLQKGGQSASQFAELANMIKQAFTRKEGERKLRISEERYRSLFENSVDAVMLTTNDFESILSANPSACKMFQMTEDTIKKIGIKGLIIDDRSWSNILRRLNQTGISKGVFTYRRKDGSTFTGETTHGILTGVYGIARISMIVRDITDRRIADEAIHESEMRFRTYIDNAPEGIFIVDARGNYMDVNRTACSFLNYSREELLDLNIRDITKKSVAREALNGFNRLKKNGKLTMETILVRKDGMDMPVFMNAVELPNHMYMAFCSDILERKRAVDALKESEEKYRNVFDWANDAILLHTLTTEATPGYFIDVNRVACNMLGYSKEELLSMGPRDIVPPEFHSQLVDIRRQAQTKDTFLFEISLLRKDGTTVPVESNGHLVDYEGKKIWISHLRDITKRKQTEEELQRIKGRFESLWNQMLDCIYVSDLEGNNMSANTALLALLGYTKEEVSSLNFFSMLDPEQVPMMLENVEEIRRSGSQKQLFEIRLRRKNGEYVDVEASAAIVNEKGVPYNIQGVGRDITERKKMENALAEREALYRSIMVNADIGVGFWTAEGTLLSLNEISLRRLKGVEADFVGKDMHELFPLEAEKYLQRIHEAVLSPDPKEYYDFVNLPSGKGWYLSIFGRIVTPKGELRGVQVLSLNVTTRKHIEEALREANHKLNLLSSITRHDINNQLMALDGNLTLLSMKGLDSASEELLRRSNSALNRISAMITFTKEYEDVGVKDPVWFNIRAAIEKEAEGVALRSIKIVNDVPANLEVYADPLIAKVFHNLIDNAVRHGGKVATIHFFVEVHEDSHVIICEDDGTGIRSDMKGELFTYVSGKSHGFGLFLSNEILAITGITIKEVGEPGHGAKFVMTLPPSSLRRLKTEIE